MTWDIIDESERIEWIEEAFELMEQHEIEGEIKCAQ